MAELGNFAGAYLGPMQYQMSQFIYNGPTTQVMTGLNAGWCARIMATDSRDIKSVGLNFSAATNPGTITLRVETIDASGKPSSGLYDTNATKQFTPTGGWNVVTFDSLPTSGLIPGNMYGLVLLKDATGTTCTLNSHMLNPNYGVWPISTLQASAGATGAINRANFAEVVQTNPVGYVILEDDALNSVGCCPIVTQGTFQFNNGNKAVAQKVILNNTIVIRGVIFHTNQGMARGGTPTTDLRMRVLDASNNAISGTTVTLDKDFLTNANNRGLYIPLPLTTLTSGTYRIAFDASGDGSNNYNFSYVQLADSAFQGSAFSYSQSLDTTTSFTWTDVPSRMLPFGFELDSIPAQAAGGGTNIIDPLTSTIAGI